MTKTLSWLFSLLAVATMGLLLGIFIWQSVPVWKHEGWSYLWEKKWYFRQHEFGVMSMVYGTLIVSIIALVLAVPVGWGAAVFTSEYLPRRVRMAVKILIELLAGVPGVIYGLLGILLLRDWVYDTFEAFEPLSGDTLLTAGILLAVMILPTVVTLSDDALRAIPSAQRLAARGLGLTRAETIFSVIIPQAARGLGASVLLALGRAMGETTAVFLVVGRQDNNLPDSWFSLRAWLDSGQTITSKLVSSETNIAYGDSIHWGAMVGLGLILLVMTGAATLVGTFFTRKPHA
ncbi:phosphate ABC transporter permease subunit PstC [Verrucomicrobium sp. BvORR106]|uniref:phosphate ABC transporter permease subunit PstC n=1 Tax=Verrucomicrobium sp. BvORR106 TaxID=1403819 RepID=UPI00056DB6EA|nr:phosphate ABC transporter permease subunit PstC [Verrucomicrobium sp. BvORR106]